MQDMFFSKTDRAKHLMCDRSTFRCSFDAANFCRGRFEKCRLIKTVAFSDRIGGGTRDCKRSCGFSSETREILLNCLEFSDRSLEGDALIRIRDGQRQNGLKCTGSLYAPAYRPHEHQGSVVETRRCSRVTQGLHTLEPNGV